MSAIDCGFRPTSGNHVLCTCTKILCPRLSLRWTSAQQYCSTEVLASNYPGIAKRWRTSNIRQHVYAGLWVFVLAPIASAQTKNWPQFRGAQADGLGEGAKLPDTWSTTENVI